MDNKKKDSIEVDCACSSCEYIRKNGDPISIIIATMEKVVASANVDRLSMIHKLLCDVLVNLEGVDEHHRLNLSHQLHLSMIAHHRVDLPGALEMHSRALQEMAGGGGELEDERVVH